MVLRVIDTKDSSAELLSIDSFICEFELACKMATELDHYKQINIPRPIRGYFLDGRSPMLPATPHAALVRSDICMGLATSCP